jgi:short-subunit dehydrogenase
VNIVSVSATTTFLNSSVYSASKAGVLALSRCLRSEVRKKGIRVIDVLPGAVETKMWDRESRRKHGRKMMKPSDVADVVVAAFKLPGNVLTEEIIMRPLEGDL